MDLATKAGREQVPPWPRVRVVTRQDGTGEVVVNDASTPVAEATQDLARDRVLEHLAELAKQLARPVRADAQDPDGQWRFYVAPDGRVFTDDEQQLDGDPVGEPDGGRGESLVGPSGADSPARQLGTSTDNGRPAVQPVLETVVEPVVKPVTDLAAEMERGVRPTVTAGPASGSASHASAPVLTRREARETFLATTRVEEPATAGWRGFLTRVGVRMAPGAGERAERQDAQAVSQHWPGPRTIAVVNGKGGASKTPSTILLSAVFAKYGGAGVLAWDNNQTRGTLGWRTEQGPHEATLLDLLPAAGRLLGAEAQSADLARFVHHQTRDRYDVLRSKPMALATEQRFQPEDVDAIHAVAAKYYRLVVIDSGNDESDPMWQRMVELADQLVVATTTRDDHAEAGALLLEALAERDERSARLAQNAVAVVSQADQRASRGDVARVVEGYQRLARETVSVPWDPAMVDGVLRFGSLRPGTARAWLAAGAAVARGL